MKLELGKLVVRAIIIERGDGDEIIGERETDAVPIYTVDQVIAYRQAIVEEVKAENARAEAAEAAAKPNRATRRAKPKPRSSRS